MSENFNLATITTYQAASQQSRAFRELKLLKDHVLSPHGLTGSQWLVLGFIYDSGHDGVRITTLADLLDTTQAFITNTVNVLESKGYVLRKADKTDSRAHSVVLKSKFTSVVEKIEQEVRSALRREIYSKVTPEELKTYVYVLSKFATKN